MSIRFSEILCLLSLDMKITRGVKNMNKLQKTVNKIRKASFELEQMTKNTKLGKVFGDIVWIESQLKTCKDKERKQKLESLLIEERIHAILLENMEVK